MRISSRKTKIISLAILIVAIFGMAIALKIGVMRPAEKTNLESSTSAAPPNEKTGFSALKAGMPAPEREEQSDIQSEKSYALGIIIDSSASSDLAKVKNFVEELKKNIGKETLGAGTEKEKNIRYIADPTGAKANFESYYIITNRTDPQIADYVSANSVDINAAGNLLLGKNFPQTKIEERLSQLLVSGKSNQFLILNAADPFPADWLANFQTL